MEDLKPGEIAIDTNASEKKVIEPQAEDKFGELSSQIDKLAKTVNFLSANHRHDDKLAKRVEEIYEKINTKEPEVAVENLDELDQLAQKDWKAAVRKLAKEEAAEIRKAEREEENRIKTNQYLSSALEKSKSEVMARHPEIETDPSSEKAQIFQRIVREHPDYLTNPYGPKLAMNDMEDELRAKGYVDPDTNKRVETEVNRRTRINKTIIPKSKADSDSKIILDRDEQEFCRVNGIPYEDFAKNKKTLSGGDKEGVTA